MDPVSVLKRLWLYKYWLLPVVVFGLAAAVYVMQYGPRHYQSMMTYALIHPKETTSSAGGRYADNPYLRSPDQTLITGVLIARLSMDSVARELNSDGLGDFRVAENPTGSGYMIDITGIGDTPTESRGTTLRVGELLARELRELQRVYGADDAHLFKPIMVAPPGEPVEQFSSRLRALVVVIMGTAVLMFGAVSVGQSFSELRKRWRMQAAQQVGATTRSRSGLSSRGRPGTGSPIGPGKNAGSSVSESDKEHERNMTKSSRMMSKSAARQP